MKPELIIVSGCNAAGKSTFIRSRINQLEDYQIIMPDAFRENTYPILRQSILAAKHIILENILSDTNIFPLIDLAIQKGYNLTLFQLFIESPSASLERVGLRRIEENGLNITKEEVKLNFDLNFKNLANCYYYFNNAHFIHTGIKHENELIMSFEKGVLIDYKQNPLSYIQYFNEYVRSIGKDISGYEIIKVNKDYSKNSFNKPTFLK
ncbi:hypothetical protein [Pedobacter foliorum]|uniref:hypothetical protein n=1 Tax=Pedobacter foliorum TaxID=2739058 RepID=UPI001566F1E9|nr:hypothetical protein [Pedobacter foliorum]NRF39681.1 hypothetical protein [Pedobacter foliorum]